MPKRVKPFDPPLDTDGEVMFPIGRHRNEGGGHDYGPKFDTYTFGIHCSCGLYVHRCGIIPKVRRYLASNAYRASEIRFIVHDHTGLFASEPFSIKETVYLSISQLIEGVPAIEEDNLYVIRSQQHPACHMS